MKNTIFNKFPKQPYTIYNFVRCFFAWFTFVGTANWYQGIDEPTLWQRVYKWRISPKTAWTLANGIWLDGMDIYDVERIYRLYPESFYEELERFIKDRANQQ